MMELLAEGLKIAALGIGFVYFFLLLLIFCTSAMSYLIARLFPQSRLTPAKHTAPPVATTSGATATINALTLTVITAAIHQHRAIRG